MSLPDTAEYWWDVKRPINKRVFVHAKGIICGHFHVIESNEYDEIDCHACRKVIEQDSELKTRLVQNNGKRYLNHRKKKGFTLESVIRFGKYKGQTIQWIVDNDKSYFSWVSDKLLLHPELDKHVTN